MILGVNIHAQSSHLNILMPDWKASRADEVLKNSNFHLPYSPTYSAVRCSTPHLFEDPNYKPEYKYPALMPLLIVADVPKGGKNVTWNIDNDDVQIIAAPKGSQFISKNHVVTPVAAGKINIENPYRVIIYDATCYWKKEFSNYGDPKRELKTSRIFKRYNDGHKRCVVKQKEFSIGANQTYIVVLATKKLIATATASVDEMGPIDGTFLASKMQFVGPAVITKRPDSTCGQFKLTISGGPTEAPVIIGNGQKNEVNIKFTITNVDLNGNPIDLDNVILQYKPVGENWFSPFIINGLGSGVLKPGETKDIIKKVKINESRVKGDVGVLMSKAFIFYPSAPDAGKQADFHISYIRKEQADLAGIRTRLDFAGKNYKISVINTTPALSKDKNTALLKVRSVIDESGDHLSVPEKLFNGESWSDGIRVGGAINIKYSLYVNNKERYSLPLRLNK